MTDNRNNPYTVRELIKALKKYPEDMHVVVSGYEGGYEDCSPPKQKVIDRNVNEQSYFGPHDEARHKEKGEKVVAL